MVEPMAVASYNPGMSTSISRRLVGSAVVLLALAAPESRAADTAPSYAIPIYVKNNREPSNYWIYVSQAVDGSNAVPYLFDTGSPNMFTVQGSNTALSLIHI